MPATAPLACRSGDRITVLFAVVEPDYATNAKCRLYPVMSDVGGKAENICSLRVFRILTRLGHLALLVWRLSLLTRWATGRQIPRGCLLTFECKRRSECKRRRPQI